MNGEGREASSEMTAGVAFGAFAIHIATENALRDMRERNAILAHNAQVRAIRAARARQAAVARARKDALGADLMSRYLRDRELFD